jgi:hypothetical protein
MSWRCGYRADAAEVGGPGGVGFQRSVAAVNGYDGREEIGEEIEQLEVEIATLGEMAGGEFAE